MEKRDRDVLLGVGAVGLGLAALALIKKPPAGVGILSITTDPSGGEIYVDGVFQGLSPLDLKVPPGTYTVSFGEMAGFTTPADQVVTVAAGQTQEVYGLYIELPPPGKAVLAITTTPINGEIYIDGVLQGVAPMNIEVDPGTYLVSFSEIAGYIRPADQVVTVVAQETKPIQGEYTPSVWAPILLNSILDEGLGGPSAGRIVGNTLYVVATDSGGHQGYLAIYDIADRANPVFKSRWNVPGASWHTRALCDVDITSDGNYAVVVDFYAYQYWYETPTPATLYVLDVRDKTNPTLVGSIAEAVESGYLHGAQAVRITGNYAVCSASVVNRVTTVNIANKTAPFVADSVQFSGDEYPVGLRIRGNFAFTCCTHSGTLRIVDIANPTDIHEEGHLTDSINFDGCEDLDVVGNVCCLYAFRSGKFCTVDVSDETAPVLLDAADSAFHLDWQHVGNGIHARIENGSVVAYQCNHGPGGKSVFNVWDITIPASIALRGSTINESNIGFEAPVVLETCAYVMCLSSRINIYDVAY